MDYIHTNGDDCFVSFRRWVDPIPRVRDAEESAIRQACIFISSLRSPAFRAPAHDRPTTRLGPLKSARYTNLDFFSNGQTGCSRQPGSHSHLPE